MSRIGQAVIEAQEELAPLGYSTVEEAMADGWDSAEWLATREHDLSNIAHKDRADEFNQRCREAAKKLREVAKFLEEECYGRG